VACFWSGLVNVECSEPVVVPNLYALWDLSSAIYTGKSFATTKAVEGLWFRNDGETLITMDENLSSLHQFTLSTAWDISTASDDLISYSLASNAGYCQGMCISPDGFHLYAASDDFNKLFQYDFGVAFDISTLSYSGNSVTIPTTYIEEPDFNPDGSGFVIWSVQPDGVLMQFSLSTPWDLSTAAYINEGTPNLTYFHPYSNRTNQNGLQYVALTDNVGVMHLENLNPAFDAATNSGEIETFNYSAQDNSVFGQYFKDDATGFYLSGSDTNKIYQYSMTPA